MPVTPKSGVLETTSTTGTGAYTLDGAVSGYRALGSTDNGLQYHYGVRTATQSEWGLGTYTHSTRQFTRDSVIGNYLNTTSPVNWGAGAKEFAVVLVGERVAMRDVANVFLAAQSMNGNTLWLDQDNDTGFQFVSNNEMRYLAGGVEFMRFDYGNRELKLVSDDAGATIKPGLSLQRDSTSPANSDRMGYIRYAGRDSAQALLTYAFTSTFIESPTAGSAGGRYLVEVLHNGAVKPIMSYRGLAVTLEPSVHFVTGAKQNSDPANVGAELLSNGQIIAVVQDTTCLQINRRGSDGTLVDMRRDNGTVGTISVSGGVVAYGTFTGAHDSEWLGPSADYEAYGTVVRAAEGTYRSQDRLPLVMPTTKARDPRVYGVVGARIPVDGGETKLLIHALGTSQIRVIGPVAAGDLLESSDVPGVAQAQSDDLVRASTIAKATRDSLEDVEVRLVPCVLMAG